MSELSTASASSGADGFFARISEGFSEGAARIGKDLLPVWVAGQIKQESDDQLKQPVYDPNAAPPRLNADGATTTAGNPARVTNDSIVTGDGFRLSMPVLLLTGAALLVIGLALAKD